MAPNRLFDTVLMGRTTYEIGLKVGLRSPYSHLQQVVFSRTMGRSPDSSVQLISHGALEFVSQLKSQAGLGVWLCGGAQLAGLLLAHGLIDQLVMKTNPVVLGSGIPLFSAPGVTAALAHTHSRTYANGVVRSHYRVQSVARKF